MKTCPFCAEEIQDAAILCKHCGRDLRRQTPPPTTSSGIGNLGTWALVGVVIFGALVWAATLFMPPAPRESPSPRRSAGAAETSSPAAQDITFLRSSGLLKKLDVDGNEAYVDPLLWSGVSVDAKRGIVMTLSRDFDAKGSTGRVKVYDYMSGRLLAEYSALSGVTFH